ncbi:hypothetical protein J2810_004250 [Chryseobacterium rhizosphaerae]|nr:hypothetical protein [Chryseobacterium rhizosphaerae]
MHSYIGHKKTSVGFGLLLIDMEKDSSTVFGDRFVTTGSDLWNTIKEKNIGMVATDYW